jgi:hypothetical protein
MAGDGASEIKQNQVIAAISDRSGAKLKISRKIAAGPHPLPEQQLADLRMLKRAISDEMSELCVVLRRLRLGDLAFMEEMPPGRLDQLLAATTDRVAAGLRGVPLEESVQIEAWRRAFKIALEMPLPLPSSSAGAVTAASDAPPSVTGQVAAAREDLARLQI